MLMQTKLQGPFICNTTAILALFFNFLITEPSHSGTLFAENKQLYW